MALQLDATMTLCAAIRTVAARRPDQEVLVCGSSRVTNRMLVARSEELARMLHALGARKGEKVASLLEPGAEFAVLLFAVARLGALFVPLNPDIRERTLDEILEDAGPLVLVGSDAAALERARDRVAVLVRADSASGAFAAIEGKGGISGAVELPPLESVGPTDLLALLYTSGTTGKPKATVHTHRSLIAPVIATWRVRELWSRPTSARTVIGVTKAIARYRSRLVRTIGRPQSILSTGGWHTITGIHVMLQGLLTGDRLVVLRRFHPREALRLVERERVTVMVAVPAAYQVMLRLPDLERYDTSSLFVCAVGGAPCPPSLGREIQRRFRCALHIGFGMTEAAGGIACGSIADSDSEQAESVGRPMPGIDVRIVDDHRRELPRGAIGELAVHGDGVMRGYYRAPELTASAIDEDGWLYTGDLASIDAKGFLHIVGRKNELIIRGGQNVYPAEIEGYLAAHPKIAGAAVVGVPAAFGGESVWAFIRLEAGAAMTVAEVLDYCRAALEPYKIPSEVRFVDELPLAEAGKSQKYRLRELAVEESKRGAT